MISRDNRAICWEKQMLELTRCLKKVKILTVCSKLRRHFPECCFTEEMPKMILFTSKNE